MIPIEELLKLSFDELKKYIKNLSKEDRERLCSIFNFPANISQKKLIQHINGVAEFVRNQTNKDN